MESAMKLPGLSHELLISLKNRYEIYERETEKSRLRSPDEQHPLELQAY